MTTYVITLEPGRELSEIVERIKEEAKTLVGDQLYLSDPPHITLCVGPYGNYESWRSGFEELSGEILDRLESLKVSIDGWKVYESDAVTKKDTLVLRMDEKTASELRIIQGQVASLLKDFKEPGVLDRYRVLYEGCDETLKGNIETYGYPFVGEIWEPHISIASFDPEAFRTVWDKLGDNCPGGTYLLEHVMVYELDEKTDQLKVIAGFS